LKPPRELYQKIGFKRKKYRTYKRLRKKKLIYKLYEEKMELCKIAMAFE